MGLMRGHPEPMIDTSMSVGCLQILLEFQFEVFTFSECSPHLAVAGSQYGRYWKQIKMQFPTLFGGLRGFQRTQSSTLNIEEIQF